MRTTFPLALSVFLTLGTAHAEPIDFRREVLPILSDHCFACHGPDGKTRKGDLRLDVKDGALRSKDPVVVPGKSGESEVFARIISHDPDEQMPPPKFGKPLTASQIATLKRWIDAGAPGPTTGHSTRRKPSTRPPCATVLGSRTRSMLSFWRVWKPKGCNPRRMRTKPR